MVPAVLSIKRLTLGKQHVTNPIRHRPRCCFRHCGCPVSLGLLGPVEHLLAKLIMAEGHVYSLALAYWRDTFAFLVYFILALCLERGRMAIRRWDWPVLAGMGISRGVFHVALNLGCRLNGAAITTIQQAAMPAIVLVAARMVWKEPLTGLKIFSLFLIVIGTVLVSGLIQADAPDVTLASITIGFLVPALYAGWSLFGKALRSGYSAVAAPTWAFGIASILVMSKIAFAVFYARLFLGETLTLIEIVGAIVVAAGVIILLAPGLATTAIRPSLRQ